MSFEHYLDHNKPNPRRIKLLALCAGLAILGTSTLIASAWVAGKMSIARVDAPTTEYILLQFSAEEPPPPPPPPPPPLGSKDEVEDEVEDDDEPPEDPDLLDDDPPPVKPTKIPSSKQVGVPNGSEFGVPGGQMGGIPGGSLGGLVGTGGSKIAVKPPKQEPVANKPLSVVMARSVYAPDPDQKQLQQTKAARFDKRNGRNTTSFCIDHNGRVTNVRTKTKFPGDPQVDAILRKTIESWRFKPLEIGAKTMKTCTERTFSIKFQ